tara:strand:+ start:556 stop:981 length:426 start_codon:yes stop_codon:yes gene_type:complete
MPGKKGFGNTRKTSSESPVYKKSPNKFFTGALGTMGQQTGIAGLDAMGFRRGAVNPVKKKQGYGEAKSPFAMKGFSGFGNSPLKDEKSDAQTIAKANRQRKEQIANISKERNISIKEATQVYLKKVGTTDALTEAKSRADN